MFVSFASLRELLNLTFHCLVLNHRISTLSDVTLGGAIATGTHNTGVEYGVLATSVSVNLTKTF